MTCIIVILVLITMMTSAGCDLFEICYNLILFFAIFDRTSSFKIECSHVLRDLNAKCYMFWL